MATWLSLAKSAPGTMIELLTHRTSVFCLLSGHTPDWRSDRVACKYCEHIFEAATEALLERLASPEGLAFIADEIRKRAA